MSVLPQTQWEVVIVGAGMAGLTAALTLHQAGRMVCVLEAANSVGGRVKTTEHEGFLLDEGFQVYLSAYPEGKRFIDLNRLSAKSFYSGAYVVKGNRKIYPLADPFRHLFKGVQSALVPVGRMKDKLLVAKLRLQLLACSLDDIFSSDSPYAQLTTGEFLVQYGFHSSFIQEFFTPFFSGVFLENNLETPATQFAFTYKMMSEGEAILPLRGMQAIPDQLARQLPTDSIRLGTPVQSVEPDAVTLTNGETLFADHVIVATDPLSAEALLDTNLVQGMRETTTCYFVSDEPILEEPILVLNGTGEGDINHWCSPSLVQPSYAPPGQHLLSISINGLRNHDTDYAIRDEMAALVGAGQVRHWQFLKSIPVKAALPVLPAISSDGGFTCIDDIYVCGDFMGAPSINGAMASGRKAAEQILATRAVSSSAGLVIADE